MSRAKIFSVYENLDTSFVNLGALLRYLQQRDFNGTVRVVMDEYEAEIRLRRGERPVCRELDAATGREAAGDAALQRLLVRAQDAGGRISVYGEDESEVEVSSEAPESASEMIAEQIAADAGHSVSDAELDWHGLLRTCGELIAAVERGALGVGANFDALFNRMRLELADDYAFLDPNGGSFEYANGEIELHARVSPKAFISGLCETLRRVVERISTGRRATSARERVALELAVLARRRQRQLAEFGMMTQLDRIAGTRVV